MSIECQRDFVSEQLTNSEENNLTELSLIVNYMAGIDYDKEDDHCHYGFYAKRVLIVAYFDDHVKKLGVNHGLGDRVVV